MADDELLTVPKAMARLKVGRSTVYDLIRTRQLASITIGRSAASLLTPSTPLSTTTLKRPPDDQPEPQLPPHPREW